MSAFPSSIKSFTTKNTNDVIQPTHINDLQDEVVALETGLLTSGTWTITLASAGGGTATYSRQTGYYIRAGGIVFAQGYVTLASLGSLAAGSVSISLPFTSKNQTDGYAAATVPYWALFTSSLVHLGGYVVPNTTALTMLKAGAATTAVSNLQVSDLANTSEFIFSVAYQI